MRTYDARMMTAISGGRTDDTHNTTLGMNQARHQLSYDSSLSSFRRFRLEILRSVGVSVPLEIFERISLTAPRKSSEICLAPLKIFTMNVHKDRCDNAFINLHKHKHLEPITKVCLIAPLE